MNDTPVFLGRLRQYIRAVPMQIKIMDATTFLAKPFPDKWSKKEIFGHLIDSAHRNLSRFQRAAYETGTLSITPYSQGDLVRENNYQSQARHRLISLWNELNVQILEMVSDREEAYFNKSVEVPHQGIEANVAWLIEDYVTHMEHHLKQIFTSLPEIHPGPFRFGLDEARAELALHDKSYVELHRHGTMLLELYQVPDVDNQLPHAQDELYVVSAGEGYFQIAGDRYPCKAGDALFAPAGISHRFVDCSADFETWVVFYGPKGGE